MLIVDGQLVLICPGNRPCMMSLLVFCSTFVATCNSSPKVFSFTPPSSCYVHFISYFACSQLLLSHNMPQKSDTCRLAVTAFITVLCVYVLFVVACSLVTVSVLEMRIICPNANTAGDFIRTKAYGLWHSHSIISIPIPILPMRMTYHAYTDRH